MVSEDLNGRFNESQPLLSNDPQSDEFLVFPPHLPTGQLSYDSIPTATSANNVEEEPPKVMKNTYKFAIYISCLVSLFLTVFIVSNILVIYPQSEKLINQSSEFQVENVSLAQVNTRGIDIRVQGSNLINYDNIKDSYISHVFKLGGGLFNEVAIDLQSVHLVTRIEGKLLSIGNVEIPEFKIKIKDKAQTDLNFIMSIHPKTLKVLELLKYVFDHPDEMLKIYGDTKVKLKLGGLYLGNYAVSFSHDVMGKQYFKLNLDDITIDNLLLEKYKPSGDGDDDITYHLDFQLNLPNPILNNMISFNVPDLSWLLFVGDCNEDTNVPIFGENLINTGGFKLSSHEENLVLNISTSLNKLNDDLLKECNDNDSDEGSLTPMKGLIDKFLNNKSIPLNIKNQGGSSHYPSAVNDLLSHMDFDLNYNPNFETSNLIHNVSIDNLGFEFENGDMNTPIINGDINIFIKTPLIGLTIDDFNIPKIKGLPKLLHHNIEFAEIPLKDWHDCLNEVVHETNPQGEVIEYFHLKFNIFREPVVIKDKQIFSQVINEILYYGKSKILIDCLLDLMLRIAVFQDRDLTVEKIHVKSESEITRGDLFAN